MRIVGIQLTILTDGVGISTLIVIVPYNEGRRNLLHRDIFRTDLDRINILIFYNECLRIISGVVGSLSISFADGERRARINGLVTIHKLTLSGIPMLDHPIEEYTVLWIRHPIKLCRCRNGECANIVVEKILFGEHQNSIHLIDTSIIHIIDMNTLGTFQFGTPLGIKI